MSIPTEKRYRGGNPGWVKGESANPKGRPQMAKCIPEILRRIGDEPVPRDLCKRLQGQYGASFHPKNMRDAMLYSAYADAALGDAVARAFVVERTEGKVSDRLEVQDTTPREIVFREVRIDSTTTTSVREVGDAAVTTAKTVRNIRRTSPDARA